jgi:hypothetical protein
MILASPNSTMRDAEIRRLDKVFEPVTSTDDLPSQAISSLPRSAGS